MLFTSISQQTNCYSLITLNTMTTCFESFLLRMDLPPRPEMFDFHGVPMTHYLTDNWENIQNFQARPDDIFIASYPKAGQSTIMNRIWFASNCSSWIAVWRFISPVILLGNTWVSFILDQLHFGQTSKQIHFRVPNLEFAMHSLQPGLVYNHILAEFHLSQMCSSFLSYAHMFHLLKSVN